LLKRATKKKRIEKERPSAKDPPHPKRVRRVKGERKVDFQDLAHDLLLPKRTTIVCTHHQVMGDRTVPLRSFKGQGGRQLERGGGGNRKRFARGKGKSRRNRLGNTGATFSLSSRTGVENCQMLSSLRQGETRSSRCREIARRT